MGCRTAIVLACVALGLVLAGCDEPTKGSVTEGAGPAPAVSSGTATLQITGASINSSGRPVVTFHLQDSAGNAYTGLGLGSSTSANVEATIAQLVPAASGTESYWYNYLIATESKTSSSAGYWPSGTSSRTTPQSSAEGTTAFPAGALANNGGGNYTYTFNTNITTIAPPTVDFPWNVTQVQYSASATHRVALDLRNQTDGLGNPFNASATFDFVPAGGSPATRAIVSDTACASCHATGSTLQKVTGHDGTRAGVDMCVVCHNPNHVDANSGNMLTMDTMVHKIHMGAYLPTVLDTAAGAPGQFTIWDGAGDTPKYFSFNTFPVMTSSRNATTSTVFDGFHLGNETFAAGTRTGGTNITNPTTGSLGGGGPFFPDCTKCHGPGSPAQVNNWMTNPTQQACVGCHDNITYTLSTNTAPLGANAPAGMIKTHNAGAALVASGWSDNSQCATCHGSAASGATVPTDTAHNYSLVMKALQSAYAFGVDGVTYNTTNGALTVTFHVSYNGANVDWTNFTANPQFNPIAVTGTTSTPLTAAATAAGWTTTPTGPGQGASLTLAVGWPSVEHKNDLPLGYANIPAVASMQTINLLSTTNIVPGSASQLVHNADGTFTVTWPYSLPVANVAADGNTLTVALQGVVGSNGGASATAVNYGIGHNTGSSAQQPHKIYVKTAVADFDVSSGAAVTPLSSGSAKSRRVVVDPAKCNNCHDTLNWHGGTRANNPQYCVNCHNPNNTDVIASPRQVGVTVPTGTGLDSQREQWVDFKVMIHGIHAGAQTSPSPSTTQTYGGFRTRGIAVSGVDYSFVNFPNQLSNCLSCHVTPPSGGTDTFALPLSSVVLPTTVTSVPIGPSTQWESARHPFALVTTATGNAYTGLATCDSTGPAGAGGASPTFSASCPSGFPYYTGNGTLTNGKQLIFVMTGQQYGNSNIPVQIVGPLVPGSAAAVMPSPLVAGSVSTAPVTYYVVNSAPNAALTGIGTFSLSTTPGGTAINYTGTTTTAASTPATTIGTAGDTGGTAGSGWPGPYCLTTGSGTATAACTSTSFFGLWPAKMADPTDDWNISPTAAVCSSCHDDTAAKSHMVTQGNAVIQVPSGSLFGSGVTFQPNGYNLTDALYQQAVSSGFGAGAESCDTCHGPGKSKDLRVVHKLPAGP